MRNRRSLIPHPSRQRIRAIRPGRNRRRNARPVLPQPAVLNGLRLADIIARNHVDIAHSLSSCHVLIQLGLLADAVTLLRPPEENMIDIQYLHRRPDEVGKYV